MIAGNVNILSGRRSDPIPRKQHEYVPSIVPDFVKL